MAHKYAGGCDHVHTHCDRDLIDNPAGLKRQPFNSKNPNGPLELCTCASCGKPVMLDDKQRRVLTTVGSFTRDCVRNLSGRRQRSD